MAKKQLEKKQHFFLEANYKGNKINKALFTFNSSFSNVFLTLLDLKKKVICAKSAGMAHLGNSKRKKLSTQTIDILVRQILLRVRIYRIKIISLILKSNVNKFVWTLVHKLNYFGVLIDKIIISKKTPHNGMRARKLRRV